MDAELGPHDTMISCMHASRKAGHSPWVIYSVRQRTGNDRVSPLLTRLCYDDVVPANKTCCSHRCVLVAGVGGNIGIADLQKQIKDSGILKNGEHHIASTGLVDEWSGRMLFLKNYRF